MKIALLLQSTYVVLLLITIFFMYSNLSFLNDSIDIYWIFFIIFFTLLFLISLFVYKNRLFNIMVGSVFVLVIVGIFYSRGIISIGYSMIEEKINTTKIVGKYEIRNDKYYVKNRIYGTFSHTYYNLVLSKEIDSFYILEKQLFVSNVFDIKDDKLFRYEVDTKNSNIYFSTFYNNELIDKYAIE